MKSTHARFISFSWSDVTNAPTQTTAAPASLACRLTSQATGRVDMLHHDHQHIRPAGRNFPFCHGKVEPLRGTMQVFDGMARIPQHCGAGEVLVAVNLFARFVETRMAPAGLRYL